MNGKELKIGDWVYFQFLDANKEATRITATHSEKLMSIEGGRTALNINLSPIPLTKETLKKNGWTYYGTQKYWEYIGEFTFTLVHREGRGFEIEQIPYKTFQYVHELQHILWALGMDDNLEI